MASAASSTNSRDRREPAGAVNASTAGTKAAKCA